MNNLMKALAFLVGALLGRAAARKWPLLGRIGTALAAALLTRRWRRSGELEAVGEDHTPAPVDYELAKASRVGDDHRMCGRQFLVGGVMMGCGQYRRAYVHSTAARVAGYEGAHPFDPGQLAPAENHVITPCGNIQPPEEAPDGQTHVCSEPLWHPDGHFDGLWAWPQDDRLPRRAPITPTLTVKAVADLLSVVGVAVTVERIETWPLDVRNSVIKWASAMQVFASGDTVEVPDVPDVVVRLREEANGG